MHNKSRRSENRWDGIDLRALPLHGNVDLRLDLFEIGTRLRFLYEIPQDLYLP